MSSNTYCYWCAGPSPYGSFCCPECREAAFAAQPRNSSAFVTVCLVLAVVCLVLTYCHWAMVFAALLFASAALGGRRCS